MNVVKEFSIFILVINRLMKVVIGAERGEGKLLPGNKEAK